MSTARHEAPAVNEQHMGGLYPPSKWAETVLVAMMEEAMCNRSNNFNPSNPMPEAQRNCWKPNPVEHQYANSQIHDMLASGFELYDSKGEKNNTPQTDGSSERKSDTVHVPNVGDVPYVDMKKSHEITQNADHELDGRDPNTYNCMYYIKTVVEGHAPKRISGDPSHVFDGGAEGMPSSSYMKDHGFSKAPHGELKTGDIVLVSIKDPSTGQVSEHSGIVIGKNKDGEPIIRQKPDANHPPIDLTEKQFESCYCQGNTIEEQRAAHQAGVYRKDA